MRRSPTASTQPRGALDVGEQEGDRPGRTLARSRSHRPRPPLSAVVGRRLAQPARPRPGAARARRRGCLGSTRSKSQDAMARQIVGPSAVTVATRGPPSSSDSSPKKSPGPRRATTCRRRGRTRTARHDQEEPGPISPCRAIGRPAGNSTSTAPPAIADSGRRRGPGTGDTVQKLDFVARSSGRFLRAGQGHGHRAPPVAPGVNVRARPHATVAPPVRMWRRCGPRIGGVDGAGQQGRRRQVATREEIADALAGFALFADLHDAAAAGRSPTSFEEALFAEGERILRQGLTGVGLLRDPRGRRPRSASTAPARSTLQQRRLLRRGLDPARRAADGRHRRVTPLRLLRPRRPAAVEPFLLEPPPGDVPDAPGQARRLRNANRWRS